MWPHSLVIGVNGTAVCVGTDDTATLAHLERWRIDEPADLVDYGLRLHPAQPSDRSAPRVLPSLHVGSDVLARSGDTEALRSALLCVLAAATEPCPEGLLRVSGAVLEREGAAWIVPETNLRTMSVRMLNRSGFVVWHAQTTLVDAASMEVVLQRPLGSDDATRRLPLAGLWLNHREPSAPTSPGEDVARLLGNCQLDPAEVRDRSGALSSTMLLLAASVVASAPVRYVSFGRQALENELTALFGR